MARLTVISVPQAGRTLGLGRWAAYEAAKRGEIPVITMGRRKLVPVRALEEMLKLEPGTLTERDFEPKKPLEQEPEPEIAKAPEPAEPKAEQVAALEAT